MIYDILLIYSSLYIITAPHPLENRKMRLFYYFAIFSKLEDGWWWFASAWIIIYLIRNIFE